MRVRSLAFLLLVALVAQGCAAAAKKADYSAFYAHQPRSIVIVPVMNDSPEVNAPGSS